MALSEHELYIIYVTRVVVLSLSLLSNIFVIVVYARFKAIQVFTFKLVLYLAITDFIRCFAFFLPDNGAFCITQAFIIQTFGNAEALWIGVITWCLYQVVIQHYYEIHEHEVAYHVFVWCISLATGVLPLFFDAYGTASGWCWIRLDEDHMARSQVLRFTTYYALQWIVVIYGLFAVYRFQSYERSLGFRDHIGRELILRLKYYPLVQLAVIIFPTANRLEQFILGKVLFWLVMCQILTLGLNGVCYASVFGFTKTIRQRLPYFFKDELGEELVDEISPR